MGLAELVVDPEKIRGRLQGMLGSGYRVEHEGNNIFVSIWNGKSLVPFATMSVPESPFETISVRKGQAIRDAEGLVQIERMIAYQKAVDELKSMQLGPVNYSE